MRLVGRKYRVRAEERDWLMNKNLQILKMPYLVAVCLQIFFAGCNLNKTDKITANPTNNFAVNNFFKVNLSWIYDLHMHVDSSLIQFSASFNIMGDTVIDGHKYFIAIVLQKNTDTSGYYDTCLYTVSNDSLFFNGSSPVGVTNPTFSLWKRSVNQMNMSPITLFNNPAFFTNGRLVYKFPISISSTWTDSPWVPDTQYYGSLNRTFNAERSETIDLPIGSFDCIIVHQQYYFGNSSINVYDWLSSYGLLQRVIDYGLLTRLNFSAEINSPLSA